MEHPCRIVSVESETSFAGIVLVLVCVLLVLLSSVFFQASKDEGISYTADEIVTVYDGDISEPVLSLEEGIDSPRTAVFVFSSSQLPFSVLFLMLICLLVYWGRLTGRGGLITDLCYLGAAEYTACGNMLHLHIFDGKAALSQLNRARETIKEREIELAFVEKKLRDRAESERKE